jgi:hypothetical protein
LDHDYLKCNASWHLYLANNIDESAINDHAIPKRKVRFMVYCPIKWHDPLLELDPSNQFRFKVALVLRRRLTIRLLFRLVLLDILLSAIRVRTT